MHTLPRYVGLAGAAALEAQLDDQALAHAAQIRQPNKKLSFNSFRLVPIDLIIGAFRTE